MTRRVVVADAGPLIALARIESLDLLRELFERVSITRQVHDEILPASDRFPDAERLGKALADGWIEIIDTVLTDGMPLNPGVDAGEASSIGLARLWQAAGNSVLLIMDDRAGRAEARMHGIRLIGTAAVVGLAKTQGLVPAARPLLDAPRQTGYWLGQSVIDAVLHETGER